MLLVLISDLVGTALVGLNFVMRLILLVQYPRQGERFYWQYISADINAGATMRYVAMFHEVDEGSAIFKSINNPPVNNMAKFINVDGLPSGPHLWLTGEAGKMLRNEKLLSLTLPKR